MARFAELYIRIGNATQAAIQAGYSVKAAAQQGCRLLRTAKVQALIAAQGIDRRIHAEETYRNMIEIATTSMEHVRELKRMAAPSEDLARATEIAGRQLERLARVEGLLLPPVNDKHERENTLQSLVAAIDKYTTAIPNGIAQRVIETTITPAPPGPMNGNGEVNGAGNHV